MAEIPNVTDASDLRVTFISLYFVTSVEFQGLEIWPPVPIKQINNK